MLCLDLSSPKIRIGALWLLTAKFNLRHGWAGIYANSSYPESQHGSTGIALKRASLENVTEWRYGCFLRPRWNVSGTYMQVLPRFISTDQNGRNTQEFLQGFFKDQSDLLSKIFLKGYEWPFDARKAAEGSSIIDILVHKETSSGRRVFLDFRTNPGNLKNIRFDLLSEDAFKYLKNASACFGTPFDRLLHMNQPAADFYEEKGIDLSREPLEIALCAQHNNGGLSINRWWETNVKGFCGGRSVQAMVCIVREERAEFGTSRFNARCSLYRGTAHRRTNVSENSQKAYPHIARCCNGRSISSRQRDNIQALWDRATVR